jgi:2-aminoethylphosphonate-pyruvate transaminase
VRKGLAALGVEPLVPPQESSVVLRAYRLPQGASYEGLHAALKRAGFVIYAGQGALAAGIFRIANMGEVSAADLARMLQCAAEHLR